MDTQGTHNTAHLFFLLLGILLFRVEQSTVWVGSLMGYWAGGNVSKSLQEGRNTAGVSELSPTGASLYILKASPLSACSQAMGLLYSLWLQGDTSLY